jgi:hypothetical protein
MDVAMRVVWFVVLSVSVCQMAGVTDDKTGKGREGKGGREVSEGKEI